MAIDDITRDAEAALNSALIEDYFTVNDSQIDIFADLNPYIIDAFCIAAPSILKFELAYSLDDSVPDNFVLSFVFLEINGVRVANSWFEDD